MILKLILLKYLIKNIAFFTYFEATGKIIYFITRSVIFLFHMHNF